jgi:ribosomal protein S27AE
MARTTSGGVSKATANTVTAMRRSAEKRRCPQCGRGSALKHYSDDTFFGSYCRWADCGYKRLTDRDSLTNRDAL